MLGLKHEGELDKDMLVYNIPDYRTKVPKDIWDAGWKIKDITYSIDVDTSRVFTIAPAFLLSRVTKDGAFSVKEEKKVFVDRIMEFKADGTGQMGEKNRMYIAFIWKLITKHFDSLPHKPEREARFAVDDKRKWYLDGLWTTKPWFITKGRKFEQHGAWGIANRQDMMIQGLESDSLWLHHKNKDLMYDMRVCVKRDMQRPERKDTGKTNYLDRIDAAENGILEYAPVIFKAYREMKKKVPK